MGPLVVTPLSGLHHNTSGTTRGIEGQHSLYCYLYGCGFVSLKHDVGDLFTVGLRVLGAHGEQHRVLFGGHMPFDVERLVLDLLHIEPVGGNAMINGVLQGQDASFVLGLHKGVLLTHAHHDALGPRATPEWRGRGPGNILTSPLDSTHVGSIVNKDCT